MYIKFSILTTILIAALSFNTAVQSQSALPGSELPSAPSDFALDAEGFVAYLASDNAREKSQFLAQLDDQWSANLIPMVIETMVYIGSEKERRAIASLLRKKTGNRNAQEPNEWYQWLWQQPQSITEDYANFKALLYSFLDPSFYLYFNQRQDTALIRLDEIRWGGVARDGIPPLHNPKMIAADEADYLRDRHIVFGFYINGEARAYPKRILAWHEMFTDSFAGEHITGVYCTLCGTVIAYRSTVGDTMHELGTSGFLYRSNKLMYDKETFSMWNTITGKPVLGPLADKKIQLEPLSVVTTTWGEWKRRHPSTTVLSSNTGHNRDYGEGVAYRDYFATDDLMFAVPFNDTRLKNKQEVLALRFAGAPDQQLAIDTAFLSKNSIYYDQVGPQKFVVVTDNSGANRVYQATTTKLTDYDGKDTLTDERGSKWTVTEDALINEIGERADRLPYHRAFWFGWHAAFPETRLVK